MRQAAYAAEFALARPARCPMSAPSLRSCHSEESRQLELFALQGVTTRNLLFSLPSPKSSSLVARPHGDMPASFLGMTTRRRRLAIFLPWLLSAVALALFPAAPARAAISY